MINNRGKGYAPFSLLRSALRILAAMLFGAFLVLLAGGIYYLNSQPDLNAWHTAFLEEEFTADSPVKSLDDYLALEDRLFRELGEKIYTSKDSWQRDPINRFSRGSLSDPGRWPVNWNRSFELVSREPMAGVLLIHGLTDSPYSLKGLGEKLSHAGAHVLGLRVPGHGTAPSGLVRVKWEDMAAAVELAVGYLHQKNPGLPLYLVGYSNGGALAVEYILSTLEEPSLPKAEGVVLISPEIGVAKVAALAVWQGRAGRLLGLPKLQWNSVLPEYDPFKYNSFAVNAGSQAHRLTREIQQRITKNAKAGRLGDLPPILAFQSVVDSTVRTPALINGLFDRLPNQGNELVLFDINLLATGKPVFNTAARDQIAAMLDRPATAYGLTLISNQSPAGREVAEYKKIPGSPEKSMQPLSLAWPRGVYSLSHVALPFAPDDPLYGGDSAQKSPGIQIGNVVLRGENGVLRFNPASLLRMRWNPFYSYMEGRILGFMALGSSD